MKKIFALILSTILYCSADAQILQYNYAKGFSYNAIETRSYLGIPKGLGGSGINAPYDTGQIRYQLSDSSVYVHTGSQWKKVGGTDLDTTQLLHQGGDSFGVPYVFGSKDTFAIKGIIGTDTIIRISSDNNVGIGKDALIGGGLSGISNIAIGQLSLSYLGIGNSNIGIGGNAGQNIDIGNNNIAIGNQSSIADGEYNIAIGESAEVQGGLHNATAIGFGANVNQSNSIVLGNIDSLTRVGIGTIVPDSILHIVGGVKIVNGSQGAGKVLTSDAGGGATWLTSAASTDSAVYKTIWRATQDSSTIMSAVNLKLNIASPTATGTATIPSIVMNKDSVNTTTGKIYSVVIDTTTGKLMKQLFPASIDTTTQLLTDGATITFDATLGKSAYVTLGGNRTLSITNMNNGMFLSLVVIQDGTGSRTLALPTAKVINGGSGAVTLSITSSAQDILTFWKINNILYCNIGRNYN